MFRRGPLRQIDVPLAAFAIAALAVIAAIFITSPPNLGTDTADNQADQWRIPWDWFVASAFWTAAFTAVLTWSTVRLWLETRRLAHGADDQSQKMAASIAESARAATAMEGVSESMAENVAIVKESAARQKLVTELQSRAYLAVVFERVVEQNPLAGVRFEPRLLLINKGTTPAYKVKFRCAADVLPEPMDLNFAFPLPAPEARGSVSVIGPGLQKLMSAAVPNLYSAGESGQIMIGARERIHIWGRVDYEDAFKIARFVEFSLAFVWLGPGQWVGFDTDRYNDSN